MDPTLNQSSSPWNSQQGLYDSNLSLAEPVRVRNVRWELQGTTFWYGREMSLFLRNRRLKQDHIKGERADT